MDFDTRAAHRKSRAPWQVGNAGAKVNNPYANANTHAVNQSPYAYNKQEINNDSSNDHGLIPGNNDGFKAADEKSSLQVPNPYANNKSTSRKNTRRLSIHASATAAAHTKNMIDASNLPPVPQLPDAMGKDGGRGANAGADTGSGETDNINKKIMEDLSNGTAAEIDDYYKVLTKQKAVVTKNLKENINQNQKHILELMTDLKDTQDELLQLRITTKDLYNVLDDFRDSAERRLALEEKPDQKSPYGHSGGKNTKKKDRSSILILEKMWVNELQSLFKHVEGASKFIQSVSGRHVLAESGRWSELNIGNWKATKAIHIFVLNDLVLIATKKSSSANNHNNKNNKSRLQAVHCWSLHDLQLQVINQGLNQQHQQQQQQQQHDPDVYIIKITAKSLSYIYQTDRYDHFLKITEAYNKGKNELLQKNRLLDSRRSINGEDLETDDEKKQLRESFRNSGILEEDGGFNGAASPSSHKRRSGNHRHSADILLQDISARVHSRNRSHDFSANGKFSNFSAKDKGQFFNELKRIEDRLDEVDIEIAHNKFHEGVGLIHYIENKLGNIERIVLKAQAKDQETIIALDELKLLMDVIKLKISNRKLEVQRSLSFNLQHTITRLKTSELGEMLEFYYSFGVLDKGISTFLKAVSNNLNTTVSKLVVNVQGSTKTDVGNYLSNLIIINVAIMKKTILTYKQCISPILERDNQGQVDSSGIVNWCIEEGNKLIGSITKHLYGTILIPEDPDDDNNCKLLIKDQPLFKSFLNVLIPQLDDLKSVGMNIDYLFDDILNASPMR